MKTRIAAQYALAALLAGCASPDPALYTLQSRPGAPRVAALASAGKTARPVVVVHNVELARYLERDEIVRSSEQVRLVVSRNDWWGEPLRAMLRRVLIDDIAQRLPNADVLADNSPIAAHANAEIQVAVQRFDGNDGGQVVFVGYAQVTRDGKPVLDRLRFSVPTAAGTVKDQVEAMSAALGQVADVVATRIVP